MIALEQLTRLMNELARERGPFTFFGFFHRDGAPYDKWDLVVSAPWFKDKRLDALDVVVEKLRAIVDERDFISLSRIITVPPDDAKLDAVLRSVRVDEGPIVMRNTDLFDITMEQAYIFRARRPAEPAAAPAS